MFFTFLAEKKIKQFAVALSVLLVLLVLSLVRQINFPDADIWYHAGAGRTLVENPWYSRADFSAFDLTIIPKYFFNAYVGYQIILAKAIEFLGFEIGARTTTITLSFIAISLWCALLWQKFKAKPEIWLLTVLLTFSAVFLNRIVQDKSQALGFIVFSLWLYGFTTKKNWLTLLSAAIYPWFSTAFILPLVLVISQIILFLVLKIFKFFLPETGKKYFTSEVFQIDLSAILFTLSGLALGTFFHPERQFLFDFYRTQITTVILGINRVVGVGAEWYQLNIYIWLWTSSMVSVVSTFILGSYLRLKKIPSFKNLWWLIICFFSWFGILHQSRFAETGVPLMVIALGEVLFSDYNLHLESWKIFFQDYVTAGKLTILILGFFTAINFWLFQVNTGGFNTHPKSLSESIKYLNDNISSGTRIFHPSIAEGNILWYEFKNKYGLIVGMDNSYFSTLNPELAKTWGKISSGQINTKEIWKKFKAPVVVIGPWFAHDTLSSRLFSDGCYEQKINKPKEELWVIKNPLPENCL